MSIHLLLFSIGVIAVSFFPQLPPLYLLWLLPICVLIMQRLRLYPCIALLTGLAWGIFSGHQLIAMQLDESFVGTDVQVIGVITDLPEKNHQRLRFSLNIRSVTHSRGDSVSVKNFPEKIQLSWYGGYGNKRAMLPDLTVGQVWQLTVRLKRPRGFANPAGFDYQAFLLRQGVGATGYVVQSKKNALLEDYSVALSWREWVDYQRQQLQRWILARSSSTERGILIALLVGDSAQVEKEQWNRMQKSGTSHLIAISGLHVGFLALFGFYVGLGLGRCIQLVWRSCPAFVVAWLMAIVCASFYSALAGFNIPTVRTLIMLAIFYGACLWQRSLRIADIFCCALALVLIIDPLAAYDIGFWLSFGAVALLLFYFSGRWIEKSDNNYWRGFSLREILSGFVRSQWVMFVGLLIPLSVLVSSVSLIAPLANAIAIPLITFFVVPLLLIAAATKNMFGPLSDFLLSSAGWGMEWLKLFLQLLLDVAGDYASPIVAFSPAVAALIALSCLLLLMPKGLVPRALGWGGLMLGCVLGYFIPQATIPELKVSVLDVGQGTAVVVQVKDKLLVYDTGPQYTDSFDAGGAIIAPYLFSQAKSRVDTLVVSHNDRDHAGGMASFLEKIKVEKLIVGDEEIAPQPPAENCHQHQAWQWHKVYFEFIPLFITRRSSDNNKSCVLLIKYRDQIILLPGDIETAVENQLLREGKIPEGITLLVAAHHGSKTSSNARFVYHIKPEYVVYSAGYRSQHGHPHPQVRRRFQHMGSRELNTAEAGAIIFEWYENNARLGVNGRRVIEHRQTHRRYWFD